MKRVFLCLILLLALAGPGGPSRVCAQSGGGYDLTWNSVDGGGTFSAGGGYTLGGAIGQPDAGALGETYTLAGGFWQNWSGDSGGFALYLPLILRN